LVSASLYGELFDARVVGFDAVVEGGLGRLKTVLLGPQLGVGGQHDERAGLDGGAQRPEDPFRDQQ
jgi:hypothetical protein